MHATHVGTILWEHGSHDHPFLKRAQGGDVGLGGKQLPSGPWKRPQRMDGWKLGPIAPVSSPATALGNAAASWILLLGGGQSWWKCDIGGQQSCSASPRSSADTEEDRTSASMMLTKPRPLSPHMPHVRSALFRLSCSTDLQCLASQPTVTLFKITLYNEHNWAWAGS